MADVGHPVPDHRHAHFIITVDRPGFVVHQVRTPGVSGEHSLGLSLPQGAVLDYGLDPGLVQQAMHGLIVGRFVVGQRLDPTLRQIGAGLLEQRRDHLVVAHRRFRDPVGQGQFMTDIDQEMELVAEPLHDSLHFPLGVEILLAASTGLWQSQLRLGLLTRRFATAGVQRRGIARRCRPRSGTTVANRRTIASKLARIALRWAGCPKTSRNRDRFQCFGTWASVSTPSSRQSVGLRRSSARQASYEGCRNKGVSTATPQRTETG